MSAEGKGDIADRAAVEHSWPVTVKLGHPIEFDDKMIVDLTFRRGRLGDLKGIKPDGVPSIDQLMLVASRMCGQPLGVIEKLDGEDGTEVIAIAMGFIARSLGIGGAD
jgi:hypothetical protein